MNHTSKPLTDFIQNKSDLEYRIPRIGSEESLNRSGAYLEFSTLHEARVEKNTNDNKGAAVKESWLFKNKYKHDWVDDKTVNKCHGCNREFGVFLRRHHCRYCKNIFCDNCTPFRRKIPYGWDDDVKDSPLNTGNAMSGLIKMVGGGIERKVDGEVRVCGICNHQVDILEQIHHLILIFNYAMVDIPTLCRMARVCKLWNYVASYYQGRIRNIQYKRLGQKLTPFEKNVLWTNKKLWIGHSHWSILYLQSLPYSSYDFQKKMYAQMLEFLMQVDSVNCQRKNKCVHLMCTKNCLRHFRPYHAIILLDFAYNNLVWISELYQFIIKILKRASPMELNLYLPYLIHSLKKQSGLGAVASKANVEGGTGTTLIAQFILDRCISDSDLALEVYWNLMYCFNKTRHFIYDYYLKQLLNVINPNVVNIINSSYKFVNILEKAVGTKDVYAVKKYLREHKMDDLIIPFDSYARVNYVNVHSIEIKDSATRPVLIPINCRRTGAEDQLDCCLLYKLEDVHQDYVVLKAIRLMKYLLWTLNGIELEIVDYQVRPIDAESGIVQMVPNCYTVYDIREKMKFSIFNFIMEKNPNETVESLRKKFVKSCAAYCVITYLLGVGDRHLENIMVTTEGKLFHIDYGFILGSDPKPISQPKIRITEDMIDALGGRNSIYYKEFIKLCNNIFQALRGHLKLFIHYLSILADKDGDYQKLVKVLTSRFIPGETKKTAIVQLETEIHKSTVHYSAPVIDFFHRHNKEQTLKHAGQQIGEIGMSVGKMIGGLWRGKGK